MPFTSGDLSGYRFNESEAATSFKNIITSSGFRNEADAFALVSFGGTISSEYAPGGKTIRATADNKALNMLSQLKQDFGLTPTVYTGLSLAAKDSRDITAQEVAGLMDFLNYIKNRRVLVTCGTYLLPEFARAAAIYVTAEKIVAFTGSMRVEEDASNDIALNIGGAVSAVQALHQTKAKMPFVFASFHGEIYAGKVLQALNLHPEET